MRKKGFLRKLMLSAGAICFCAAITLTAPAATISAQAKTPSTASTREAAYGYVYKIENNKMYKCLYNYSTRTFIGDWIYVRDV